MALGVGCFGLHCMSGSGRVGIFARTGKKATVLRNCGDDVGSGFDGGRVGGV